MASGSAVTGEDDDGDDLEMYVMLGASAEASLRRSFMASADVEETRCHRKGSIQGRRANKNRDFQAGHESILRDYFGANGEPSVYDEADFERRFRVPRAVFLKIYDDIKGEPYWAQSVNATGRLQSHPLQKLVSAFRVLAYGESYDRCDEYTRLSKTTINEATNSLIDFIVDTYKDTYLRQPNNDELAAILTRNAQRGVPGCIGSIDCSHWTWRNCPKGHSGMYQSYKKKWTIVMETVCDEDLYIWHFFIGTPGSNNDLNFLRQSPLYHDVISGWWPPRSFPYTLNGRTRSLLYYLADGVYPRYPFFATPYPTPQTPQDRTFNRLQEALRKDVERLYAVLTSRFHVALHPARFTTVRRVVRAGQAIAVLHNMVVKHRRDGFLSRQRMGASHAHDGVGAAGGGGESGAGDGGPAGADGGSGVGGGGAESGGAAGDAGGRGVGGGGAGGGGPTGAGGQAAGGLGADGLPPVPNVQAIGAAMPPPEGSFLYELRAREEATDVDEFMALRDDLAAHVWEDRGALLEPYL